jgi:nitroimidazol reductase NimA-like FMN-containing flavoprotein (pyridoxamine 5'-phosphate oxidase superfamily)
MRGWDPGSRTKVRRHPDRAVYEADLIGAILDEALICHVGFVDDGAPVVIPTIHARIGGALYLHGSPASRMLTNLSAGAEVCVTATLLDGLVLARSLFHHSMNYRSAVIFGRSAVVTDRDEKNRALRAIVDHVVSGRTEDARPPNTNELSATLVLRVDIDEASAKVRSGPPNDQGDDVSLPIWSGVIPLSLVAGEPIPDLRVPADVAVPAYAESYSRPRAVIAISGSKRS